MIASLTLAMRYSSDNPSLRAPSIHEPTATPSAGRADKKNRRIIRVMTIVFS